ncbi:MAG: VTT domain-containing protein [Verrucomicrobiales bacterium]|nr:VTT domain-containing protein [Verrucomicrobiales bacterium]
MKRLFLLFIILALLVIGPFLIWGAQFEEWMTQENTVAQLQSMGAWAWAVGIGLLVIDLFLPILGTVVMSALGLIYGWFLGGILSAAGSIMAGVLAYVLCRKMGRRAARWLAGDSGLSEGERLFQGETGGWLVALSRWMPVLPEVVACMAGLSKMSFSRFFAALCAGSIPMGFVFAWIGDAGEKTPGMALILSAGLPPVIWGVFRFIYLRMR